MNRQQFFGQSQVIDDTPILNPKDEEFNQHIIRDGIITIRPKNPSEHKNETLTFGGYKGYGYWDTGRTKKIWFGIPLGINADGSTKFKKIQIVDGRMFYLKNPEDALDWHIIRHHFSVEGSPNQFGKPRWIVEDDQRDSKKSIAKAKSFVDVYNFIDKMADSRVKSFGRIFGLDPTNNSVEIIKGQLFTRAMEKPDAFVPYMKDAESTSIKEGFHRALSTGVITFRLDRGYLFNENVPIGMNEEMAIGYLMSNKDLFIQLDIMARQKDNSLSAEEKSPVFTPKKQEVIPPIPPSTPANVGSDGNDDLNKKTDKVNASEF